jgi:hypothetical protein
MEDNKNLPEQSGEIPEPAEPVDETKKAEAGVEKEAPSAPRESLPAFEPMDVGGKPAEEDASEVFVPEEALAPTQTRGGRFKNAIRRFFIWLLVFAFVYLAGVVTIYILEFQPAKDALEQTQLDLDQANQQIADLQLELDQAKVDLSYNAYLQVVVDVYGARLALIDEDTSSAKIFLADAEQNMEVILPDVAAFDQALANSLTQRLNLVVNNVDSDIDRALQDAQILSDDLMKVFDGIYALD